MEGAINAACAHVPSIRLCTAGREGYQLLLDQLEKEMIDDWDRVERVVKELLEDLSGRPRSDIGLEDTLLLDLGVTGDDISFVFIPETARLLGLTPTRSAWESVWTVRDAIQALVSSADTSSSGKSAATTHQEPDGEASYVHCLLTTLAKRSVVTVHLSSVGSVPALGQFAETDDERKWIAALPFRNENLNAERVSYMLRYLAGYRFWHLRSRMYELTAKLVTSEGVRPVRFAIGREGGMPANPITITRLP